MALSPPLSFFDLPFPQSSDTLTDEEALANLRYTQDAITRRLQELERHPSPLPPRLRMEVKRERHMLGLTRKLIEDIRAKEAAEPPIAPAVIPGLH